MSAPSATVIEIMPNRAVVRVDEVTCPRCKAGKGCGAGLFAASRVGTRLAIDVTNSNALEEGQQVRLGLANARLSSAAMYLYGLPLLGILAGASVAGATSVSDRFAATLSIVGLLLGALAGRWLSRRDRRIGAMQPVILEAQGREGRDP